MPENLANLHVVGRTADGRVWHTIRSPTGWTAFDDVLGMAGLSSLAGHVVDVSCARRLAISVPVVEGLYVLLALDNQPPILLLRSSNDGTWSQQPGAFLPTSRKVAAGTLSTIDSPVRNEIHLAAVTDDGHLVTAVNDFTATQPTAPDDLEQSAGETGDLRFTALTSQTGLTGSRVPLLAVTADGRLLLTSGRTGQWGPLTNLLTGAAAGTLPADVLDADVSVDGSGTANYVAVTGDGHVWLAANFPNGTWRQWRDLETYTYSVSGPVISGTFTGTEDVGTFATVSTAVTSEGLHVAGVTTNGRIWHQLRNNPLAIFRDIELVGLPPKSPDVGTFTAIACS